ncbi:MAG: GtrA family protein [Alphaproteobacteria bacterium]|nr:GtrA family protein [Alphaproteobacteria bacterium]
MISQRFIKFLITGGVAAAVNFGSRIVLGMWMGFVVSIIIAYCIGMVTAFILNRLFVFENPTNALHHQVGWFIAVNLAAVLQTLAVSLLLADYGLPALGLYRHDEVIAHAFGVLVPAVTSYIGHKHLTFQTP